MLHLALGVSALSGLQRLPLGAVRSLAKAKLLFS